VSAEPDPPKQLSTATARSYSTIWEMFADWCDVTDHAPLPADPAVVLAFLADCPAAPATQRRRVIAIDHHHTTVGHHPPGADPRVRAALGRPPIEPAPVAAEIRSRVDAALRALPNRGWTGGLFGRRDRCLLVLSQLARIPHQPLARLTAGDVAIAGGVATITGPDRSWTLEAMPDPVLCGPCAIARWLDTHRIIVTKIATRAVADHLDSADSITGDSTHVCRRPSPASGGVADSPLLASPNQWGQTPFPLSQLSRLAVARQARDLLDGIITVHRQLPVNPIGPAAAETVPANHPAAPAASYGPAQHRAALDKRRADIAELADVATELDAVDRRAAELNRRITELLDSAIPQ
jgi:hypothetical protein